MHRFLILVVISSAMVCLGFFALEYQRPEAYFTKGNVITFMITSENGAVSYSEVLVKSVDASGSTTSITAYDNRLNDQRNSTFQYRLNFYSDSLNWCVDAINHLNCRTAYSSNYFVDLTSDSLVYPYAMKIGDTLQPASASEIIRGSGQSERHVKFITRKVMASEAVGAGGETMQAWRIECKMITTNIADYGALGKIPTETTSDYIEWFVPSKGIVMSVIKTKTGETRSVLQGVK